ncbi:MAG: TMEM175 family protein, partial [Actinomycetota bacterium]|nr:TMEM175 family protein [Actinomycetota bacterium]
AFSDGVFAIAITLLVLELKVPDRGGGGALWRSLVEEWPSFAAYLTSFFVIGIMWVNHHAMFRQFVRADRVLLFLNLLLLLWTALLPFPTSLLARYLDAGGSDSHVAAALYSANLLLAAIAFSAIWGYAVRGGRLLAAPLEAWVERRALVRFGAGTLVYAATVGLAFLSAPLTLGVQFLVAVYYCFDQVATPEGHRDPGKPPAPA